MKQFLDTQHRWFALMVRNQPLFLPLTRTSPSVLIGCTGLNVALCSYLSPARIAVVPFQVFVNNIFRAHGRVVNMTSGLGRIMVPSRSVYAITKWAAEGFSDCLRYEMQHWGVKVGKLVYAFGCLKWRQIP